MPKSRTSTPSGSLCAGQRGDDRDAEAVVAFEDVAETGDEGAHQRCIAIGSTSSGAK